MLGKACRLRQECHNFYGGGHLLSDWFSDLPPQEGMRVWYCKPGQRPVTARVIGPRGGTVIFILLNRRSLSCKV